MKEVARLIWLDIKNLSAGKQRFLGFTSVMIILNLTLFQLTHLPAGKNDLYISRTIGFALFLSAILTMPSEIRDGYADRITLEFGGYSRRIRYRISALLLQSTLMSATILIALHFLPNEQKLAYHGSALALLGAILGNTILALLGALLGAIIRSYALASVVGSVLMILDLHNGLYVSHPKWWTISGSIVTIESTTSPIRMALIALFTSGIFTTSYFLLFWIVRKPARMKARYLKVKPDPTAKEQSFPLLDRAIAPFWRSYVTKAFLVGTDRAYRWGVPISLFWFGVVPILGTRVLLRGFPSPILAPFITSQLCLALFASAITIGGISHRSGVKDREILLFGGSKRFIKTTTLTIAAIYSTLSVVIFIFAISVINAPSDLLTLHILRSMAVLIVATAFLVTIGTRISLLDIDTRLFLIAPIAINFAEEAVAQNWKAIIPYLPSSLIGQLAGGRGLYAIAYGSKRAEPLALVILFLAILILAVRYSAIGKWSVKRAPSPIPDATETDPPCASITAATMESPSPLPSPRTRTRDGSAR